MAFGDALGAVTEFGSMESIRQQFPPNGPQTLIGNPALVTDDTQMALAVGKALITAPLPYHRDSLSEVIREAFIEWYHDPENNRAPGVTCLTSCENLIRGLKWEQATNISSKGCGANMRVQPVGCLALDLETRAAIAQFQAAYTHAHPTGMVAADLTAYVIHRLGNGGQPDDLMADIRDYAESQRGVYHAEWLGDLWERAHMMPTEADYINYGWSECIAILDRIDKALEEIDYDADPCLATGAGWIAEEAFATALYCFLMYPDNPEKVIQRAAFSSGDSDSIACIAGSFAGAYHGLSGWQAEWVERIEYRDDIQHLAERLDAINMSQSENLMN